MSAEQVCGLLDQHSDTGVFHNEAIYLTMVMWGNSKEIISNKGD